jgi:uncharacterized protein YecT (DUF1311 family)
MSNEIIVVKQLPVIVEQLAQVKETVIQRVQTATSLVCTDETVKEVKKARAELNNEFKSWEEKRKEVKTAVMTPYEQFEAVYKDCVSDTYKKADAELKAKIEGVEKELKQKKADEVKEYFNEYRESAGIDFVTFEQANIYVTISASMKSLKEQAKAFIDRIDDDLALIDTQEHKAEILVEYKKTLNASAAVTGVNARFKAIEDEKRRIKEAEERRAAEEQHIAEITSALPEPEPEIIPPVEEQPQEPEYTLRFKVTATKAKLRELKAFLDNGGYKYE